MSLRIRLTVSILAVLLVSLGAGGLSAGWTATQSVRTELQAALANGARAARGEAEALLRPGGLAADPGRLVRAFDGSRHLRAALVDPAGRPLATSVPAEPREPAPDWLVRLVSPSLPAVTLPLPGTQGGALVLRAEPLNEVAEVWGQLRSGLAALALFCVLGTALVSLVVGWALRPLGELLAALAAVGSDGFAVRLRPAGARELVQLAQGFNAMVERLGAAEAQNRRLHEQLVTIQEEERAELARDLHDEVGPFLFCVSLDAAAIERAAAEGRHAEVPDCARSIRRAVEHMQGHVRSMLGRLRPASPVELGLAPSLRNLVAFWQARRPAIAFALQVAPAAEELEEATQEVIYRLVQEGLTNAVRHGRPGRIEVQVTAAGTEAVARVRDDGVGLAGAEAPGFGLTGLRERVAARGGVLDVAGGAGGRGLCVTARLPLGRSAEGAVSASAA